MTKVHYMMVDQCRQALWAYDQKPSKKRWAEYLKQLRCAMRLAEEGPPHLKKDPPAEPLLRNQKNLLFLV